MEFVAIILVAAITFGLCFLVDKGFQKTFRGKAQHRSGLSVRLNKKYGAFGLIFVALGIAAVLSGWGSEWILTAGGGIVVLIGCFLIGYYMTFGIFYDEDSFLLTTFGKKSAVYAYGDILNQQLYNSYGNIIIELHLADGRAVSLPASMIGVYPFLDHAFAAWCHQTGVCPEDCAFHDPQNSRWFPEMEES